MSDYLGNVLSRVGTEVRKQRELKAAGKFKYTPEDKGISEMAKLAMLMEEVGEVSTNVLARAALVTDGSPHLADLEKELTQVAAIAVAWLLRYERMGTIGGGQSFDKPKNPIESIIIFGV